MIPFTDDIECIYITHRRSVVKPLNICIEIKIDGEEVIEKEVKPSGNGAIVFVPKRWLGSKVKVIKIASQ